MDLKSKTRAQIFFLSICILSPILLPVHHPNVFRTPCVKETLASWLFDGITRWDGQYFLSIAEHGYIFENQLAFFPLFPFLVRTLAKSLELILPSSINSRGDLAILELVGVLLNSVLCILNASLLRKITLLVVKDETLAQRAELLYLFSPAKVFLTSFYSESLYAFLTFHGIYECLKNNLFFASIFFGLSTAARSNGMVNSGYLCYFLLLRALADYYWNMINLVKLLLKCIKCALCILVSVAPFFIYMWYGYSLFCLEDPVNVSECLSIFGHNQSYHIVKTYRPVWCDWILPNFYSYIQDTHWNVGFLRYYKWKQLPNFVLAMPVVTIILMFAWRFFHLRPDLLRNVGITKENGKMKGLFTEAVVPFVIHGMFLAFFGLLFMHVQVTTRLIASSTPLLYWVAAYACRKDPLENTLTASSVYKFLANSGNWTSMLIKLYFVGYAVVGCVLFSINLPWT